ncbi:MAG: hypothetical protein IPL87_01965 [Candidatus Moraniibacteriota bacterium]|nr:MAG: hypothetical protein IPL87_01965 [Candidatus Moranbacteria bacterium]
MKLCRLKKVPNKTAVESERAIQGHFSRLPQQLRRSITRDNGTENVLHGETKQNFLFLPTSAIPTKVGRKEVWKT